ncbi:hypothetical protein PAL_GLEAN10014538 [Pteropus alecto]|uniref:Uncharacterized protein n=1 Tax=Pteropus alecto TaxID=9402 RepID=L5KNN6_PTEAL|nr:hypothetical protein PAL_GLEAN10014538 [Pteropus alecto]
MSGLAGTGDAPRARLASPLSISPLPGLAPGPREGSFRAEPGSEFVDSFGSSSAFLGATQTLQLGLVPKASWRRRHSTQVPRPDPSAYKPQRVREGSRGHGLPDKCRRHWAAQVLPAQREPLRAAISPTAQAAAPHKLLHERLPQLRVGGVCRCAAAALPGRWGAGPGRPGGARG